MYDDLRAALRSRRSRVADTTLAAVVLGVTFGVAIVAFAATDSLLFKPLPVHQPERLLEVCATPSDRCAYLTLAEMEDVRALQGVFSHVAGYAILRGALRIGAITQPMFGELVTPDYFETLGVSPILGRTLAGRRSDAEAAPEAVISYELWTRRFGSDPQALGRTILVNGVPLTVVGVAPPHFRGLYLQAVYAKDLWVPLGMSPDLVGVALDPVARRGGAVMGIARRRAEVSDAQASAALAQLLERLRRDYPSEYESRLITARRAGHGWMRTGTVLGESATGRLWWVAAIGALTLFVGIVSVWGMMLADVQRRARELATRLALGASRLHLFRSLMAEFTLIGMGAVAVAVPVATLLAGVVRAFPPPAVGTVGFSVDPEIGIRAILFCAAIMLASVLLFGLGPALWGSSFDRLSDVRNAGARGRLRIRFAERTVALVVVCALTVALLGVAGAFADGLRVVSRADYGVDAEQVATLTITAALGPFDDDQRTQLLRALDEDACVERLGAAACAMVDVPPLTLQPTRTITLVATATDRQIAAEVRHVSPAYFRTMGLRTSGGRTLTTADLAEPGTVAVVNRSAARALSSDEGNWDRVIRLGRSETPVQVVGIVSDAIVRDPTEGAAPVIYRPMTEQAIHGAMTLLVRSRTSSAEGLVAPAEQWVRQIDPDVVVSDARTVDRQAMRHFYPQRAAATVVGAMGVLGIALAAVSVFALVRSRLAAGLRAIAIRRALGATTPAAAWPVCRAVVLPVLAGQGAGIVLAYWATALTRAHVGGPVYFSVWATGLVAVALLVTAGVAAAAVAVTAGRIEPAAALRAEP